MGNQSLAHPTRLKAVEEIFAAEGNIWHLHIEDQIIRTTGEHPFYVENKGWTATSDLQIGDLLLSHDGRKVSIVDLLDTGEVETVYNARIADYHTYFVGESEWGWSVWAHNDCHHIVSKYKNLGRGFARN